MRCGRACGNSLRHATEGVMGGAARRRRQKRREAAKHDVAPAPRGAGRWPDETLKPLRSDALIRLDNVTCPYCGTDVTVEREEEHVIARRFVPKGTLAGLWNLV